MCLKWSGHVFKVELAVCIRWSWHVFKVERHVFKVEWRCV